MIKNLTGRNRILKVLEGGIPDRLPFAPMILEYFINTLPFDMKSLDPVDVCRKLGVDIIERWVTSFYGFYFSVFWENCFDINLLRKELIKLNIKYEIIRKDGYIFESFETPFGTLTQVLYKNKIAGSTLGFHKEMLIKSITDLRAYQYLWEAKFPYPIYAKTKERLKYVGEDGVVMVTVPCTPILHLISYDLGIEKFSYFFKDYPNKMEKLMNIMSEKFIEACKIAVSSPARIGIIPENSGTLLVSPMQFEKYCEPILSEYGRIYLEHNKFLLLHACGHLRLLLEKIAKINGLSGVESLTTPPTGDVQLCYARTVLKNKTIIGGLDPVTFLRSTPLEIEKIVKEIIEQVKPGAHFILMPSDSTPPGVPIENFEAVKNTIYKYGQWIK